jgi:hypothetical protein
MIQRTRLYEKSLGKEEYTRRYKKHNMTMKFKRYGITEETYLHLRKEQGQKCAMCHSPFRKSPQSIHIDHCHKTGKVRGILCDGCNLFLGRFESPKFTERIERASAYLRKTEKMEIKNSIK